jgi:hypothetical protein
MPSGIFIFNGNGLPNSSTLPPDRSMDKEYAIHKLCRSIVMSRLPSATSQATQLAMLHSELRAGSENLAAWLRHVHSSGAAETLFELETWLRGLRSFFDPRRLPLVEQARREIIARSFEPELRIARQAIQTCEECAVKLMSVGQPDPLKLERPAQGRGRRGSMLDSHMSRILEQPTPLDSLDRLVDVLNDLRVWIDSVASGRVNCRLYLAIGRSYGRGLRSCRFVDLMLSQRFKLQFDRIGNAALSTLVRGVADDPLRRKLALAFLHLHRMLRYLRIVQRDLAHHRAARHNVVIFSLLQEETEIFAEFLRVNFLRRREHGHSLRNAAELIIYSMRVESLRVLDTELSGPTDSSIPELFAKLENSHGLLQNCFRYSIVSLAQAFDPSFDSRSVVPEDGLEKARTLQQDLWGLRRWICQALDRGRAIRLDDVLMQISVFRERSLGNLMYRDWGEFELLADALIASRNQNEICAHLRKFAGFLETLIHEVSKRSVLQVAAASSNGDIE